MKIEQKKPTAVKWLKEALMPYLELETLNDKHHLVLALFEWAEYLEREDINNTFLAGSHQDDDSDDFIAYYKKTFNNE